MPAVFFLASALLGQQPERKLSAPAKAQCEAESCVSKVLNLSGFSTLTEFQEVLNAIRTVADIRYIDANPPKQTVTLKAAPEQLAAAEKLVMVLETLRSSGGHDRSSILVYQLKGPLAGTNEAARFLEQSPQRASTICELNTCIIKALYLPDFSTSQLEEAMNRIRMSAQMTRISLSQASHVLVFRGTSEQVALAEKLVH